MSGLTYPASGLSDQQVRDFSEYGGGFVDYSDNDYTNGVTITLAAGVPYQVTRDLAPTANNYRFNRDVYQF